eukprot:TRINITY_DN1391_c0_g1_i7.p1 TRINITY_DN1391_c0_g1~~TRINITY_DN1391_c0_g1_i7.p1  ORF type:complete len:292 (-),score=98.07 TRINITY_DN1391_c0_g1_i7:107-898(-)
MADDWEDLDDDDFDADALLAAGKKKQQQSEDEDDSEEEREKVKQAEAEKEEARARTAAAKAKKEQVAAEIYVPLEDKEAEKLRQRQIVEAASQRLADDLFAGCDASPVKDAETEKAAAAKKAADEARVKEKKVQVVVQDAFDQVELKTQADVERLIGVCMEKFEKGKVKNGAAKFLTDLLKALECELDFKELDTLRKSLESLEKTKRVDKRSSTDEKRKTNEKLDKHTKFNASDEVSLVYGGGGGEDWDDWDEDWDDWDPKKK